ncbi:unnamed protein product [Caenorhabditis sp. 36 PRJEB53466]|nr:unnamed protein product [Caenorhabditis sp. 36 PRJEB53466]
MCPGPAMNPNEPIRVYFRHPNDPILPLPPRRLPTIYGFSPRSLLIYYCFFISIFLPIIGVLACPDDQLLKIVKLAVIGSTIAIMLCTAIFANVRFVPMLHMAMYNSIGFVIFFFSIIIGALYNREKLSRTLTFRDFVTIFAFTVIYFWVFLFKSYILRLTIKELKIELEEEEVPVIRQHPELGETSL